VTVTGATLALPAGSVLDLCDPVSAAREGLFADALERMRQQGELRADASPAVLATALLASIERGWC
jgi:hypothetical protein